ncbi:MAG: DUF1127 domain-containing protein [Gammaproteobacteria bacterium]|nr:DUF1127 domain-containing protein [Gammaproteobacteria bacterium]
MSTLCTQPTSSSSTNSNYHSSYVVGSALTHRAAAKAKLAELARTITQFFVIRYNQRIDRQAFNNVLTLDDRALKDIGVTRQDVKWASRLPLSEDAALKLESIARRR